MKKFIQMRKIMVGSLSLVQLFFVLGVSILSNQVFAIWDEHGLQQAAEKARADVALLANGRGEIYKELGDTDSRREVLSIMQFNRRGELINGGDIYPYLAQRVGTDLSIGLYYAAALENSGSQRNENLLETYSEIIYADYDSQKFAFDQLRQLDFTQEQSEEYERLLDWEALSVNNVNIKRDQDKAEICIDFSKTIASEPEQQWRSLVNIDPKPLNEGTYQGNELCYLGEWQTTYDIYVSDEIISDNGIPLDYSAFDGQNEVVFTGDREPMVRLGTKGQTIIADEDAALTVESANVDTISVKVWSVPITNLAQEEIADLLNPAISHDVYMDNGKINRGARVVYEGEFEPNQPDANVVATARLRLADMGIADAGVYIVNVSNKLGYSTTDQIAFSVAEVGFSAYKTDDGLWAELRDLRDFSPVSGAQVVLYSRDNSVLATAKTDKEGIAGFEQAAVIGEGGAAPDHLIYQDKHSLAYLYLDHQGYDLSDKGLDNRRSQADIQSWLWLDRGVYRPNDSLHAMWLLRHDQAPYAERDLWLELRRPDGSIMHEQLVSPDESGAYHFDYEFANTAQLGPWQLSLSLGKNAEVIDQSVVRVDAIVAQQIETELNTVALTPNIELSLQADWLYGAPAKGLRSDGEWQVKARQWSAFSGWQFGRHDETLNDKTTNLLVTNTDENGQRDIEVAHSLIPASTQPLSMTIKARVFTEDGQVISADKTVDVPREQPYAALNIANNQAKVMLVKDDGSLVSDELNWSLYRVYRNGYWYRSNDYWQYQYSDTKTLEDSGRITTSASASSTIDLPIDDGLWLLEVNGNDTLVAASTMIEFGSWTMTKEGASPETLTLSSDKERYRRGDEVKLTIRAPFDGVGSVKLAHGDIFKTYRVEFKDHEATLRFKWDDDWSQGVWILASAWHDRQGDEYAHTQRAVGLTWLGSEFEQFALNPSIDAPAEVKPDGKLTVSVEVPDADNDTWVNVAIIDEGLYRLAPPSFSNPLLTFYGKPSWALSLYDIWGEIIRQTDAAVASLRSGAGGALLGPGMAELPNIDTPLITYWSTPQRVVDGKVSVQMDVPRFHGRLRVMALAYNDKQLGSVEGEVIVKEDVVSNLYMPLFASPEDEARVRIRLHNTTEQEQTVAVTLSATGLDMQPLQENITLSADEEHWVEQAFVVGDAEAASVQATINEATIKRDIDIRPKALSVLRKQYQSIAPGASVTVPMGSAYSVGGLGLDAKEIGKQLRNYPYYCSEQTASRLFSAVFDAEVSQADLINTQARLVNLQRRDGGFGLWQSSADSDLWLSAFVGEALLKAQANDALTLERPLTSVLNYLRNEIAYGYGEFGGYGYVHYILAKGGVNMQGAAIRYTNQLQDPAFDSDNLEAVLALYLYGENERAEALWQKLSGEGELVHYQTGLSELAKRLYRLYELSEYRDVATEIGQTTQSLRAELDGYYSTQELVWLYSLANFVQPANVSINGETQSVTTLSAFANDETTITNLDDSAVALSITDRVAGDADALIEQGYRVKLTYTDFEGNPLTAESLPVNQKILIKVAIHRDEAYANRDSEIMFVYPYTAGEQGMEWEASYDSRWAEFSENRDDRHLAAFTMYEGETELDYEFAIRTAREGIWHAPGPSIEDMYRPDLKAQYPTREAVIGSDSDEVNGVEAITLQSLQPSGKKNAREAIQNAIEDAANEAVEESAGDAEAVGETLIELESLN